MKLALLVLLSHFNLSINVSFLKSINKKHIFKIVIKRLFLKLQMLILKYLNNLRHDILKPKTKKFIENSYN